MGRYSAGQGRVVMDVEFEKVEQRVIYSLEGAVDVWSVLVSWNGPASGATFLPFSTPK